MSKYDYYKMHDYSKISDSYDDIPTYQDFNYKRRIIASYLVDEDMKEEKNGLVQKIENLQTKMALSKIKKIIINEMKKGYYQNCANVREIVDIDTHEVYDSETGKSYYHIENMYIWQNGYFHFNCFNQTISGIIVNDESVNNKKKIK